MAESRDDNTSWKLPLIPPLPPGVPMLPGLPLLRLGTASSPLMPDVMRLLRLPTAYTGWSLPQFTPASVSSSTTRQDQQFRPIPVESPQTTSPQPPAVWEDGIKGATVTSGESANNVLFQSGTLLSCGVGASFVKRVDDLTAVDFVLAGSLPQRYRLEWCRIVSMRDEDDFVVIHLKSGDNDQVRVIRLSSVQPLFVPGQGWSSRRPEGSQQRHGLRCCQLSVGDRVGSLIPRAAASLGSGRVQSRKRPRHDGREVAGNSQPECNQE